MSLVVLALPLLLGAGPADDGRFYAGAYSFSDELGGFRITAATGSGTRTDPIEIVQDFPSASAVTMVIRAAGPIRPFDTIDGVNATGHLHVRIVTRNESRLPWVQFEFELQEHLDEASVFGDGLSFDQRRSHENLVGSDDFAEYSRDFEPYDRLLFRQGVLDAGSTTSFRFFITDFTPRSTFYLKQDPLIPSS